MTATEIESLKIATIGLYVTILTNAAIAFTYVIGIIRSRIRVKKIDKKMILTKVEKAFGSRTETWSVPENEQLIALTDELDSLKIIIANKDKEIEIQRKAIKAIDKEYTGFKWGVIGGLIILAFILIWINTIDKIKNIGKPKHNEIE